MKTRMRKTGESLDSMVDNETHWQDVKERAAIAAMQAIISNPKSKITSASLGIIPQNAVCFAEFLVGELKKEYEQILADSAKTCKDEQVTFTCIDKKVTMSVQELIDYYIDNECANTAEECNF